MNITPKTTVLNDLLGDLDDRGGVIERNPILAIAARIFCSLREKIVQSPCTSSL